MDKVEIVIFTNEGKTYMFKNMSNFKYTTQGFSFEYVGDSTKVTRHAKFNNTCVAGFALAVQKEDE